MGQRIVVVNNEGYAFSFPEEKREWALSHGYSPATKKESRLFNEEMDIQGGAGLAKAVVRGAGRGASVGLSDIALAKAGKGEETLALKEAHPIGSLIGEGLGFAAGLYATGGGNLIAGLGAKAVGLGGGKAIATIGAEEAAKKITGKIIAQKVAQGAFVGSAEGAISGLSQAVSESALQDKEFTASSALAHMGDGAVGGALLGAFGAAAISGASAGGRAIVNAAEKANPSIENFARERALKAVGMTAGDLKKLKPHQKAQYADDLLNHQLKEDGKNVLQAGDRVKGTYERVAIAREELFADLKTFRNEISDLVDKSPDVQPNLKDLIRKIDSEVIAPLKNSRLPTTRNKANKVAKEISDLRAMAERGENISIAELQSLRQEMANNIYPKAPPGGGFARIVPEAQQELMHAERVFEDYIGEVTEKAAEKLGPEYIGRYKDLKRLTSSFIKLSEAGEKGVAHQVGNRWVSPSDYGTGAVAAVATASQDGGLSIAKTAAAVGFNKIVRERGSSVAARVARNVMDGNYLSRTVNNTVNMIQKAADNFLRTGIPATTDKFHETFSHRDASDYEAKLENVREFVRNPEPALTRINEQLDDPETATFLGSMALKSAHFLADKAPKNPHNNSLQPFVQSWKPPREAVAKWEQYYKGVTNPLMTIEAMGRGEILPEGIEALKAIYPPLYNKVAETVLTKISQLKTPLSYDKRVKLSVLLGKPTDETLKPKNIAFMQQIYKQPASQPPQRAVGASAANVSSAYLSRSDKVQQRLT